MTRSPNSITRAAVSIESLESRTFLSASPTAALSKHSVAPAAKVRLTIPAIAGLSYVGTATSHTGFTAGVVISITSESKGGALHGSLTVSNVPVGAGQYKLTGSVTLRKKVSIVGRLGRAVVSITGTLAASLNTLIGKYFAPGLTTSAHGTVSTSVVVQGN